MGPLPGDSYAGMTTTNQGVHESHCGPWTSSSSHTQELVRNADSQVPHPELLNQNLSCKQIPGYQFAQHNPKISESAQWALRPCTQCISIENLPASLHRWEGTHLPPVTLTSYHEADPHANCSLQGNKAPTQKSMCKLPTVYSTKAVPRLEESRTVL